MPNSFSAEDFVRTLESGALDGQLNLELRRLSTDQLEQVALLLAQRLRDRESKCLPGYSEKNG